MQDQQLDAIEIRHLPEACAERVRGWFDGRVAASRIDGTRSVHVPHPEGGGRMLKIKGAGFAGAAIRFGAYHNTGPKAAQFDFDGRMMDDVASGWDGAFKGGASFQQAATEYAMGQRLMALGYEVIPCLGYGRAIRTGGPRGLPSSITSLACAPIPT